MPIHDLRTTIGKAAACAGILCAFGASTATAQQGAIDEAEQEAREHPFITASTAATTAYFVGTEVAEDDFARARDFADARYTAIRRDAATGSGENLYALAALLNTPDPDAFGRWAQANYATLFHNAENRDELVSRIVAMRSMDAAS